MKLLISAILIFSIATGVEAQRLVCLGDSITTGIGLKRGETFCELLGGEAIARHGAFAHGGLFMLPYALSQLPRKPKVATVMYGMNDCYQEEGASKRRVSREDYRSNMRKLIKYLRRNRIRPILMTPNAMGDKTNPEPNRNVNLKVCVEEVRKLAKAEKVPLVDIYQIYSELFMEGIDLGLLTYDGVHPTAYGQRVIYEAVKSTVWRELRRR